MDSAMIASLLSYGNIAIKLAVGLIDHVRDRIRPRPLPYRYHADAYGFGQPDRGVRRHLYLAHDEPVGRGEKEET